MWDARTKEKVQEIDCGAPVKDLVALRGGSVLIAAGNVLPFWTKLNVCCPLSAVDGFPVDNKVISYDLLSGGKALASVSSHQKAITCLAVDRFAVLL